MQRNIGRMFFHHQTEHHYENNNVDKPLMTSHLHSNGGGGATAWPVSAFWTTADDLESWFNQTLDDYYYPNDFPEDGTGYSTLMESLLGYNGSGLAYNDSALLKSAASSPNSGANSGPSMLMRFVCESVVPIPLCLLGIVGNILAVLVLCRQKQRQSTTLILQTLAIIDTLVLLTTLILRSFRYVYYYTEWRWLLPYMMCYKYIFYCVFPLVYFLRLVDTWLTVLLTIDRYIAVRHPLHAQRLCTYPRAVKHVFALFMLAFLFTAPRFFEYKLTSDPKNSFGFEPSPFGRNMTYTVVYKIVLFFGLMYLLPMALLIILNALLVRTLRTAENYRAQITTVERGNGGHTTSGGRIIGSAHAHQRSRSITAVVATVVMVAILCNLTAMITHLLYALHTAFPTTHAHLDTPRRYLAQISNVFVTFNSAINFVIYCLCSRNFRTGLKRLLRCYAEKTGLKRSHSSLRTTTTGTYISLTHSSTIRKKCPKGPAAGGQHTVAGDTTMTPTVQNQRPYPEGHDNNNGSGKSSMDFLPNKLLYA